MHIERIRKKAVAVCTAAVLAASLCGCAITVERPDDAGEVNERHIENLGDLSDTGLHNNTNAEQDEPSQDTVEDPDTDTDSGYDETSGADTGETSDAAADDSGENAGLYTENTYDGSADEGEIASYQDLKIYTDDEIAQSGAGNVGRFAYERLSSDEKKIYNEIDLALNELSEGAVIDCSDADEINKIFVCVMTDHPEIFWTSGYTCSRYTRGDELEAVGFRGNYTRDALEIADENRKIEAYVNTCLSGLPSGDDYSKIKYIYEYIIRHTEYDLSAEDNQNICSVFINGRSVCQGYAKATQYLLWKAGVVSTLVSGVVGNNESHSWNLVSADGAYYYVDTTWGDASYIGAESMDFVPEVSYDYLCVTTEELLKTHTPQPVVDLPWCGSMKDNYYVREGAYFTGVDTEQMSELFAKYISEGRDYVTLKCSDDSVYGQVRDYLIDSQYIFDYIPDNTTVSYWETADENSISFKL